MGIMKDDGIFFRSAYIDKEVSSFCTRFILFIENSFKRSVCFSNRKP